MMRKSFRPLFRLFDSSQLTRPWRLCIKHKLLPPAKGPRLTGSPASKWLCTFQRHNNCVAEINYSTWPRLSNTSSNVLRYLTKVYKIVLYNEWHIFDKKIQQLLSADYNLGRAERDWFLSLCPSLKDRLWRERKNERKIHAIQASKI